MRFFKFSTLTILCIIFSSVANSQTEKQDKFYNNLLISEEYSATDESDMASQNAREKLQAKKNKIDISFKYLD